MWELSEFNILTISMNLGYQACRPSRCANISACVLQGLIGHRQVLHVWIVQLRSVLVHYLQTSARKPTYMYRDNVYYTCIYVYIYIYWNILVHMFICICEPLHDIRSCTQVLVLTVLRCCPFFISTHAVLALNVTLRSQTQSACVYIEKQRIRPI